MSEATVETRAGKIRGKKENESDGTAFYSFKGIPYAEPPVGLLRFADPQPLKSWTDIRDATSHGPNCAQIDLFTRQFVGSDDCLYLNVYARSITPGQRWPVMVWIYGGAFIAGSGDDTIYGPDFFMRKDVVLVTINYRVGVLGFLNLDDEVASGNQGLKDQVMALKWVQDNIANFGGDPGNVTIFGESSGGVSVHYLCLSSLAKGLFHKAISQSGVAINPWAYQPNPKDKAYRLCEQLGYTNKDPNSIVEFLRKADAKKLIEAQEKIASKEEKIRFDFPFGPSTDSKSKTPFMPINPEEATARGVEVPFMIGHNSREGICFLKEFLDYLNESSLDASKMLHSIARDTVKKLYNLTPEDVLRIYFNDQPITKESIEQLADFSGDLYFVEGIQRVIQNQIAKKSASTYVYQFTYDKEPSLVKTMSNIEISGASHADELAFLFRGRFGDAKAELSKEDSIKHKITKQMIELWVNFATTGKPTPTSSELVPVYWQPVDEKSGLRYLNICEDLRMEVALDIGQQYIARKYPKQTRGLNFMEHQVSTL